MEIITKINIKGTRAQIYVDGEEKGWIRRSTLKDLEWEQNQPFDAQAWEEVMQGAEFRAALDEGARYLASPRSRREVIRKLLSRGYREDVAQSAADRLESYGYIADADLAQRTVESYAARGEGRRRIRQRLLQKGIGREDSESALEDYSDEDEKSQALAQAQKLARKYSGLDPETASRRLTAALMRRGFSWEAVSAALAALQYQEEP